MLIVHLGGDRHCDTVRHCENGGILVYSICLISISNSVSVEAANISLLNIERSQDD